MKLAMAQMAMSTDMAENLKKSLRFCEEAKGSDLLFFPEIQLCPFFPQYEKKNVDDYCLHSDAEEIRALSAAAGEGGYYMSPNVYLEMNSRRYDTSLWIDPHGELLDCAKMVHIAQAEQFYEQDYYTPSDDGFKVYGTPFGKIGVVICFDRHLPDGIRGCAQQGAELIIIPTANILGEPLELFEWEVRVQSFQNTVFTAMCNRVGPEGELAFAGQSLLAAPDGGLQFKAGGEDELYLLDVPLEEARQTRISRPWLTL